MMSTTSASSFCLLVTLLGHCSEPAPARPEHTTAQQRAPLVPAEPERKLPQQTQTTRAFMRDHANEAFAMRRAVIAGRFDELHRASAIVASDAWSPQLRPDYLPHVTAVRSAASVALDAQSMPMAGAALGRLGDACATCHREHGGPPQPAPDEITSNGVGTMAIHAAAEQAMWEGLFTPSEASWKRGAERLAAAPELGSDVEDVAALGRNLRDLALGAAAEKPRGEVYGRLIATCATCHRRLSIEPR
jgi:cytochrome c556